MYQKRYNLPLIALVSLTFVIFLVIFIFFLERQKNVSTSISNANFLEETKRANNGEEVFTASNSDWLSKNWTLNSGNFSVYIPDNAVVSKAKFTLELVPEPEFLVKETIAINGVYKLSGEDEDGEMIESFFEPIVVFSSFTNDQLQSVHRETLALYFFDTADNSWVWLPTTISLEQNRAVTKTEEIGTYSLRGKPIETNLMRR